MPWLVGAPLLLSFIALILAMKQWRDMKRSPYFFMRQQAGKRLQSYLSLSFVLMLAAAGAGFYGYRAPVDATVRMAVLSNSKPAEEEVVEIVEAAKVAAEAEALPEASSGGAIADILLDGDDASAVRPELPDTYDQFEPQADLKPGTELGALSLSTDVTEDYDPIQPGRVFAEGFYTLYATFDYVDMSDGMEWAWVWRHNGTVVDGGNELWAYGEEGPGYIYLSPEEGFQEGEYSLEVWVNGELLGQAEAIMNDAAVAAGN
jgi:hypothetical protein